MAAPGEQMGQKMARMSEPLPGPMGGDYRAVGKSVGYFP